MSRTGYVVAFPECCAGRCRLVLLRPGQVGSGGRWLYARSVFGRAYSAVWSTRADARRAARAFLGTSREPFRVVPVGRMGR